MPGRMIVFCLACAPINHHVFLPTGRFGVPGGMAWAPENDRFIANTPARPSLGSLDWPSLVWLSLDWPSLDSLDWVSLGSLDWPSLGSPDWLPPREAQVHNQMSPGALRVSLLHFSFDPVL